MVTAATKEPIEGEAELLNAAFSKKPFADEEAALERLLVVEAENKEEEEKEPTYETLTSKQ